jgi:hypothetical protein
MNTRQKAQQIVDENKLKEAVDLFNRVIAKAAISISFDEQNNMLCKLKVENEHCLPIAEAIQEAAKVEWRDKNQCWNCKEQALNAFEGGYRAAESETELLRKSLEEQLSEAYSAGYKAHQSQLKESEEKLKIAKEALTLIEYVDNHGGVNQYRSCAEIAKEALGKIK